MKETCKSNLCMYLLNTGKWHGNKKRNSISHELELNSVQKNSFSLPFSQSICRWQRHFHSHWLNELFWYSSILIYIVAELLTTMVKSQNQTWYPFILEITSKHSSSMNSIIDGALFGSPWPFEPWITHTYESSFSLSTQNSYRLINIVQQQHSCCHHHSYSFSYSEL